MLLLKKLIRGRIFLTLITLTVSILSIVISLYWNAQISFIVNTVNEGKGFPVHSMGTTAFTILLSAGAAYALSVCSGLTCETMAHDMRMGYARYFTSLTVEETENINSGAYLSKLQNEISDAANYLRDNLFIVIDDIIRFIFTLTWMFKLNYKLALLANAPLAFLVWYTYFSSGIIGEAALKSQQANTKMNSFADTLIAVFPILRLFDAVKLFKEKYENVLKRWENAGVKEEGIRAKLMSLSAFLSSFPLILLFFFGGNQILNGETTLGVLYIFVNLSGNISGVMMNMPGRIAGFRRFAVNMERLAPLVLLKKGD